MAVMSKENSPFEELRLHYTVTETGRDSRVEKDPYRAQENHEAGQGGLMSKTLESRVCV